MKDRAHQATRQIGCVTLDVRSEHVPRRSHRDAVAHLLVRGGVPLASEGQGATESPGGALPREE